MGLWASRSMHPGLWRRQALGNGLAADAIGLETLALLNTAHTFLYLVVGLFWSRPSVAQPACAASLYLQGTPCKHHDGGTGPDVVAVPSVRTEATTLPKS